MTRGRTAKVITQRWDGTRLRRGPDELVVEELLEVHLDGRLVATTMRTPGHDFELAVGRCHGDGLLGGAPVVTCRYCATGSAVDTGFNVVSVDTAGRASGSAPGPSASATAATPWPVEVLASIPGRVRAAADPSGSGGAVTAAAVDRAGEVLLVREDVGLRNAVDKVVGRLLLDGRLPAHDLGLLVGDRLGAELVERAAAAGFGAVVALGAPSSLAVEVARAAGMALAGFGGGPDDPTGTVYSPGG